MWAARLASLAAGGLSAACAVAPLAAGPTTRDGVFTVAQALRGQQVYEEFCLSCHDVDFYAAKLAVWRHASVGELFAALSATMPSANPGGLTSAQYLDVLAYVFSITGSPPGDEELALDNMDAIEIVTAPSAP